MTWKSQTLADIGLAVHFSIITACETRQAVAGIMRYEHVFFPFLYVPSIYGSYNICHSPGDKSLSGTCLGFFPMELRLILIDIETTKLMSPKGIMGGSLHVPYEYHKAEANLRIIMSIQPYILIRRTCFFSCWWFSPHIIFDLKKKCRRDWWLSLNLSQKALL